MIELFISNKDQLHPGGQRYQYVAYHIWAINGFNQKPFAWVLP